MKHRPIVSVIASDDRSTGCQFQVYMCLECLPPACIQIKQSLYTARLLWCILEETSQAALLSFVL